MQPNKWFSFAFPSLEHPRSHGENRNVIYNRVAHVIIVPFISSRLFRCF